MSWKIKKTIPGQIKGKVSQLSKNQRNTEKYKQKNIESKLRVKKPQLILNVNQYKQLVSKLKKMIKQTHPEWTPKQVNEKIREVLPTKK